MGRKLYDAPSSFIFPFFFSLPAGSPLFLFFTPFERGTGKGGGNSGRRLRRLAANGGDPFSLSFFLLFFFFLLTPPLSFFWPRFGQGGNRRNRSAANSDPLLYSPFPFLFFFLLFLFRAPLFILWTGLAADYRTGLEGTRQRPFFFSSFFFPQRSFFLLSLNLTRATARRSEQKFNSGHGHTSVCPFFFFPFPSPLFFSFWTFFSFFLSSHGPRRLRRGAPGDGTSPKGRRPTSGCTPFPAYLFFFFPLFFPHFFPFSPPLPHVRELFGEVTRLV